MSRTATSSARSQGLETATSPTATTSTTPAVAVATATAGVVLVVAVGLVAVSRPWERAEDVAVLDIPWIGALGVRMHLGMDGVSAPIVLLTCGLTLLACAYV